MESSDLTDKIKVSCRGRVVNVSDSQSSGPGFESHSDHYLDLFLGSPDQLQPTFVIYIVRCNQSKLKCRGLHLK